MNRRNQRTAFTLIELLTVMAIITLLIGLLTPALSGARDRSKTVAVQSQINAMGVGLESFHGDQGMYPPSRAEMYTSDLTSATQAATEMVWWEVSGDSSICQGAHLLVDALVGRDLLGYDPKAKKSTDDTYDRWKSDNDRRAPYIPKDGVDLTSLAKPPEDAFGKVLDATGVPSGKPQPKIDNMLVRVFRDKFGWPILYYRASPTANQQSTPIIQSKNTTPYDTHGDGVYDGVDNEVFTSYTDASNKHKIKDANQLLLTTDYTNRVSLSDKSKFAEFIRSIRATTYDTASATNYNNIVWPRPVRFDTFILLSAGKDGIFGTLDDVANFNVLSEDR